MENEAYSIVGEKGRLVIAAPHAGKRIPVELQSRIQMENFNFEGYDVYSEEIFAALAKYGQVVIGRTHRELIDFNRGREEIKEVGGVLPEIGFHGNVILLRPHTHEEREGLLSRYWDSYQKVLTQLLEEQKNTYGSSILIAGHTMEGIGPANGADFGKRRPEISVGTLGYTMADKKLIDIFVNELKRGATKLDVQVDKPFAGNGYITRKYGNPGEGFHAIQVEVNIDSYKDLKKRGIINYRIDKATQSLLEAL